MNSSFLSGKLALVTGGSGTIGQAIAKSLLSSGASVVLTARGLEKLEAAKEKLLESIHLRGADAPHVNVHVISSDVSKEASVVELFKKIDDLSTGVDLLINNAGTSTYVIPVLLGTNAIFFRSLNSQHHSQARWYQDLLSICRLLTWKESCLSTWLGHFCVRGRQ